MRTAQESVHLIAATVGFISFFLLWLAIVWGLILRNGWASTRIRHATAYGIHQTVALLGLCLAAVHTFAQLAAPGGPVRLAHALVPFLDRADPIGIGVGVIGLETMTAAALSILIQRRLGYSRWRALHAMTYVAFMLVVAHVLISGSDVGPPGVWGSVMAAWLVTVILWLTTTPWARDAKRQAAERMFARQRGMDVAVDVDALRCGRFGFCEHEAPDVFKLRSDGRLSYLARVSEDQVDAVIRAVEVCPARAISLSQAPTSVLTARTRIVSEDATPTARAHHDGRRATVTGLHRHGDGADGVAKGDTW